jgi:glucokinase
VRIGNALSNFLRAALSPYVLGADLGGTNVRVLLADAVGAPVADLAAPTPSGDGHAVLAEIATLARSVAAAAAIDWSRVVAMGVGVPGVVPADGGGLRLAPNLPSFAGIEVGEALVRDLGMPVALDNDVNLATLAEQRHGLGVGVSDFVFLAVGTGVGMGIVASGRPVAGATGAAGEIASLPLGADPYDRANQERGPLEERAGGIAVARRYAELAGPAPALTAVEIYRLADEGDAVARAVVDEQARALALGVVSAHALLDPELVVLGGGIGSRPDLAARVRAEVARLTLRDVRIEVSSLGARAGLLGAAELALRLAGREDGDG